MANEGNVILEVKNLKKYFKVGNKEYSKSKLIMFHLPLKKEKH